VRGWLPLDSLVLMYGLSTALAKSFASNQAGSSFLVLVFVAYSLFVMGMLLPVYVYTLVIEKESRVMLLMQIVRIECSILSLYISQEQHLICETSSWAPLA